MDYFQNVKLCEKRNKRNAAARFPRTAGWFRGQANTKEAYLDVDHLAGFDIIWNGDRVRFESGQTESIGVLSIDKLQRYNAHADQVGAMDALERFGDDGCNRNALKLGSG